MSTKKHMGRVAALVLAGFVSLGLSAVPAQAGEVGTLSASCGTTSEVCRDIHSSWQGGSTARLSTYTSNVSSGTAYYEVRKGDPYTGTKICSGYMGYNSTKTCYVGSYTGKLTFGFWKGQGSLTTIGMTAG